MKNRIIGLMFAVLMLSMAPMAKAQTATFIKADTATQGSWQGVYGSDGFTIENGPSAMPAYATTTPIGSTPYTWAATTTDVRALETATSGSSRAATCIYSNSGFTLTMNLSDGAVHQVAMYFVDWDMKGRAETVTIKGASGATLDTENITNYVNGQWLVWNISGAVTFNFSFTVGPNSVLSGIFFDPNQSVLGNVCFALPSVSSSSIYCGVPPYTWTILSGSLPAGLSLNAMGMLVGTPTAHGSTTITVQLTDSKNATKQIPILFTY